MTNDVIFHMCNVRRSDHRYPQQDQGVDRLSRDRVHMRSPTVLMTLPSLEDPVSIPVNYCPPFSRLVESHLPVECDQMP